MILLLFNVYTYKSIRYHTDVSCILEKDKYKPHFICKKHIPRIKSISFKCIKTLKLNLFIFVIGRI